jgi:hypothetical protein
MAFQRFWLFVEEILFGRLTDFDTPGHFLTLGDKTGLFLAVFLKKVDVL